MKISCIRCGREEDKEQAILLGWTVVQQASGPQGSYFVLCSQCKTAQNVSIGSATMDVRETAVTRLAVREARQKRSKKK